ncbi:MAG: DUF1326 domain-containing protein [Kordiimonadaceae bacterium]|jgi:hypothetical protein|nr:DUF1326 domain-containing protein [Kordiimonadaceae bacterium]MBT6032610.1 DUF1326 domain-containing protein [Kordiimonadaceae bacterium]MBT6330324.1 DUF1326 domain-containing protein [Kordiimonadaceae bacterium]
MTMKRRDFNKMIGAVAISQTFLSAEAQTVSNWSLEANVAECCSCEIPCPCNFGLGTKMRCDGNRLIEIYKGHVGDVDLKGVRFLVTFEMGVWTRIYVDETMSDDQMQAFDLILPLGFSGFKNQSLSIEKVPLSVTRQNGLIKYSAPASEVEMKPLKGMDGGQITVDGLPNNAFFDYVQYQSVVHTHEGPDQKWSHSGTNGFTSRMMASG